MTRGILCAISEPSNRAASQEAFDYECREAHKSRREFLQGGNIDILSHEHYARKQERNQVGPCMDVYELSDIEPMISGKVLLEEGGDGPLVTHTYTYKLIRSDPFWTIYECDKSLTKPTAVHMVILLATPRKRRRTWSCPRTTRP